MIYGSIRMHLTLTVRLTSYASLIQKSLPKLNSKYDFKTTFQS